MFQILDKIKNSILEKHTIFGNNGFVYYDEFEFIESGVSDKYVNMFYLRTPGKGHEKYKLSYGDGINMISYNCRMVVQLAKTIDKVNALKLFLQLLNMQDMVMINTFSDDTDFIMFLETGSKPVIRDFYLLSFDFTVNEGMNLVNVCNDCLC